jgi:hypothetical protein
MAFECHLTGLYQVPPIHNACAKSRRPMNLILANGGGAGVRLRRHHPPAPESLADQGDDVTMGADFAVVDASRIPLACPDTGSNATAYALAEIEQSVSGSIATAIQGVIQGCPRRGTQLHSHPVGQAWACRPAPPPTSRQDKHGEHFRPWPAR